MTERPGIAKSPTGIDGMDDITRGGLPTGRPTLVCGGAGCGKTLFAMSFLVHGARELGEPGLFVSFEERPQDIVRNFDSLGFGLGALTEAGKFDIEHIAIDSSELTEIGEYDLEGLFIRLELAIDRIGARRIALDTIESLFSAFSNRAVLRAELRRLFDWLKERGLTAIVTGERGDGAFTRHGLEEYVSDCVILLDHRVKNQVSTRRMRIVKYRGTGHGSSEYPFLIDDEGFSVLPVTALGLDHEVSEERVPSGIADLDAMIDGGGFHRGSSILISGVPGSGKSTVAASFAAAACARGERALYFSFEESANQHVRNLKSVGLSLERWIAKDRLRIAAARPTFQGLEMHLSVMLREVARFRPQIVVLDPVSAFASVGDAPDVQPMFLRMLDYLKGHGITAVLTSLTHGNIELAQTDIGLSSLMDGWLLLLNRESNGEYNRELYVLKARGTGHSNQVREFRIASDGLRLHPPYVGPHGALTGSARVAQEAREREADAVRAHEIARRRRDAERRLRQLAAQLEVVQADLDEQRHEIERLEKEQAEAMKRRAGEASEMIASRRGNAPSAYAGAGSGADGGK